MSVETVPIAYTEHLQSMQKLGIDHYSILVNLCLVSVAACFSLIRVLELLMG